MRTAIQIQANTENRSKILATFKGEVLTIAEISKLSGISTTTINNHMGLLIENGYIKKLKELKGKFASAFCFECLNPVYRVEDSDAKPKKPDEPFSKIVIVNPFAYQSYPISKDIKPRVFNANDKAMQEKLLESDKLRKKERSRPKVYVGSTYNMV